MHDLVIKAGTVVDGWASSAPSSSTTSPAGRGA